VPSRNTVTAPWFGDELHHYVVGTATHDEVDRIEEVSAIAYPLDAEDEDLEVAA
jgi:hypothetical protein